MTPRQLRDILFDIDDQEMTIKELRYKLFNIKQQDTEIDPNNRRDFTYPEYWKERK